MTTGLTRWTADFRLHLFACLSFAPYDGDITARLPKLASPKQAEGLQHLMRRRSTLALNLRNGISFKTLADSAPNFPQPAVYVGGVAYNWFPAWRDIPPTTDAQGRPSLPARTAGYRFDSETEANAIFALLCSSLGYWWWAVASDGFNLKKWLLDSFPIALSALSEDEQESLARAGASLRTELREHYVYKDNKGRIGNYFLPACGRRLRQIDDAIAQSSLGLSADFFEDIRNFNASFSRASVENGEDADDAEE